ncbi:hypothetical protein ROZALSC1DRAFT_24185 [Rozella allomycis CSF55]|uniref:AH domain-containing protein n=1 Tax=Rozella allomycis (strain CSF55) TaxID=988480 RepID=A0A4P9YFR1_ROZAC|nr:hypothetical protein ROZALSC1DRAFT_24185 [Rozella allomycis CSF55]
MGKQLDPKVLPSIIRNFAESAIWIAEKNILQTKNLLFHKVESLMNTEHVKDAYLVEVISDLNKLKQSYKDLSLSIEKVMEHFKNVSSTRNEIANILDSVEFKTSFNLSELSEISSSIFSDLGKNGLRHYEKLSALQQTIDTFQEKAISSIISLAETQKNLFQNYSDQMELLGSLKKKLSTMDRIDDFIITQVQKLELSVHEANENYLETAKELHARVKILHDGSKGVLSESFEQFLSEIYSFYSLGNEIFDNAEDKGIPVKYHDASFWSVMSK